MIEKMKKTEFIGLLAGILAAALAPKLGIPEGQLGEVFLAIGAMVSAYIAQRGYVKSKLPSAPAA